MFTYYIRYERDPVQGVMERTEQNWAGAAAWVLRCLREDWRVYTIWREPRAPR